MTEAVKHLWDYGHPYYCAEGNWFKTGQHALFESWREFTEETTFFNGDREQNLLIRWDWKSWQPNPTLRADDPDELTMHFVLQRKALLCSVGIAVTDADEPAVREFLTDCARTIVATWEPMIPSVTVEEEARPAAFCDEHDQAVIAAHQKGGTDA